MERGRRWLAIAAVSGLAVVLLAGVARALDPGSVARALAEARGGWFAVMVVAFAANHALRIARWKVVLAGDVPWRRVVAVCLVAFLGITVLPLRLGELLRPALHVRDGVPLGRTLAAMVVERILDLLALAGLLAWAALTPAMATFVVEGVDVSTFARRGALVGAVALTGGLLVAALAGDRLAPIPVVGRTAAALAAGTRELAGDPGRAAAAIALTGLTWGSSVAYTGCALAVLPSLPSGVGAAAFTWAAIMATITALPTPGFFGSYEAGAVAAVALSGGDADLAVVFALGLHLAYVAFVAALGIPAAVAELDTVWAVLRARG